MKLDFKSLLELLDYYKDENTCKKLLAFQRWGNNPACPHCGALKPYVTNRGYKCRDKDCSKKFSVTVGTIFEGSKIGLRTWYAALFLATNHKKGISSCQLASDLDISQSTAWFVLHRIREIFKEEAPFMLTGTVAVDETFVGGKAKNKHRKDRQSTTPTKTLITSGKFNNPAPKTIIVGALEVGGRVVARKVPNRGAAQLTNFVKSNIATTAIMVTDEHVGYGRLKGEGYEHYTVNHKAGQYLLNGFTTNGIENFWSLFKRGIIGIYHHVSPKHVDRYCVEFAFRYNERHLAKDARFQLALKQTEGKRLKYFTLTSDY